MTCPLPSPEPKTLGENTCFCHAVFLRWWLLDFRGSARPQLYRLGWRLGRSLGLFLKTLCSCSRVNEYCDVQLGLPFLG